MRQRARRVNSEQMPPERRLPSDIANVQYAERMSSPRHSFPRSTSPKSRWGVAAVATCLTVMGVFGHVDVDAAPLHTQTSNAAEPQPTPPTLSPPVTAAPTLSPVPPVTSTTTPLPSPEGYVKLALDFIEKYALRRPAIDWPTVRAKAEARSKSAQTLEQTYPIIIETIEALKDNHSSFVRPVAAVKQTAGSVVSYGFIALWPSRVIATIAPNSAAQRAGLRVGDRIDRINDKSPTSRNGVLFLQRDINGDLPKTLSLIVKRKGLRRLLRFNLTVGEVTLVSIPTAAVVTTPPVVGAPLPPEFGLLEVPGLVGDPQAQINYAQQLQDAIAATDQNPRCGWIIDLRRNRGGYIYAMLAGIGPILGTEPFGGRVDASGTKSTWSYRDGAAIVDGTPTVKITRPYSLKQPNPAVAVLLSSLTASAGEAVAISFRGRPETKSFGEPTAGLTTFNVRLGLPDGAFLDITNAADTDRNGVVFTGAISPDQRIAVDWSHINDGADPVLNAAQKWLREQSACQLGA
jgi:carboxyl-terminal processing protease